MIRILNVVGLAEDTCGLLQEAVKTTGIKNDLSVVLLEEYPHNVYGQFLTNGFIVLNMGLMKSHITNQAKKRHIPHVGYALHDLMVRIFGHELRHVIGEKDESVCDAYGLDVVERLVRQNIDIEPNLKEGYVARMVHDYRMCLENNINELNEYEKLQKRLIDEGIVCQIPNGKRIVTLRDYIVSRSDQPSDKFCTTIDLKKPRYNPQPFVSESTTYVPEDIVEVEDETIEEPVEEDNTPARVIIDDPTDPGFDPSLLLPENGEVSSLEEKVEEVLESEEEEEEEEESHEYMEEEALVEGEENDGTMGPGEMLKELIFRTMTAFFYEEDGIRLSHTKDGKKYRPSIGIWIEDLPIINHFSGTTEKGRWSSKAKGDTARNGVYPPREDRPCPLANIEYSIIDIFPYGGIKIIEQNPYKDSEWAEMVNNGEYAVQVMRTDTDEFIGVAYTEDGENHWHSYSDD